MSTFAETIKRLRLERNMTQEEFANLLGTTKQNISRYEKGEVSPMLSTAKRFAKALGISIHELNGGTEMPETDQDQRVNEISEIVNSLDSSELALALMFLKTLKKK